MVCPAAIAPPPEWPKEVQDLYDPVRALGKGGFASVMLAKYKPQQQQQQQQQQSQQPNKQQNLVAMKVVGPSEANILENNNEWRLYAHRELDILQELNHSNIIKVIQVWENNNSDNGNHNNKKKYNTTPIVIALQYVKGPTVQDLLLHRGALNPHEFGRVVIAQLVDAISYLHSHAVIHRDIKPDNVIVTGALSSQEEIWIMNDNNNKNSNKTPDEWERLRKKWHVTLIDFGFARALTPDDVTRPSVQIQRENMDASYSVRNLEDAVNASMGKSGRGSTASNSNHGGGGGGSVMNSQRRLSISSSHHNTNIPLDDLSSSAHSAKNRQRHSTRRSSSTSKPPSLNHSFSRKFHRQMSALGNRHYAAPEILKVQQQQGSSTIKDSTDLTETISNYVSEYGLLVDAYSLGHTIRYMMTGVPPYESVEEKIAYKRSTIYKLGKLFTRSASGSKKNKISKIYRSTNDLPGEVQRLIGKLTERLESDRTSVRAARRYYPWIDDVLPPSSSNNNNNSKDEITYLALALKQKKTDTTKGDNKQEEEKPKQ